MAQRLWTRDEEIIVFNLYCKIPFSRSSKNHPEVKRIAELIGRTPSAVNMKIGNLGSFDETLKARGIKGLENASKLDAQIWAEFNNHWDELAFESERLIAALQNKRDELPVAGEKSVARREINQDFFRRAVLASYQNACCVTGLNISELLTASRIKSVGNEGELTNPANGLCLNTLHDRAFDLGFITVTPDYKIHVATDISDAYDNAAVEKFFRAYDGQEITCPEKFSPLKNFLEYHNDVIFRR
ncbi:MAG: hypothetical protein IJ774_09775 [Selenomonadaceae bacterium]|nr:hypothetical protein [Selenomonadaceae bacterium]